MLNFVHMPKTAGTSFRIGAEQYFGSCNIAYDYNQEANETSELVHQYIYGENKDPYKFFDACKDAGITMISGHVSVDKFIAGCGAANTVTFVRDPVQRIASEYSHHVRINSYQGSFEKFYRQNKYRNRQLSVLGNLPVAAYGFIGVTEHYKASLSLINHRYGISIPELKLNRAHTKRGMKHDLSSSVVREISRLNNQDINFYNRCRSLLMERSRLVAASLPWVHGACSVRGAVVSGWAWWAQSEEPVSIVILVNGFQHKIVRAVDFCPPLCRFFVPRRGYVGFRMPLDLKGSDCVDVRVEKTGQVLLAKAGIAV
ncbi:sulfotransferase family 2 domain-containing protein [Marinobacter sp. LV10MA510-1]|uniref:sulfotransferase family 2 domain-containing protein n=1 Tax=Marinobacter sp. LV10MA510-1 TaxID=1415567 RepID=UPI000BF359FF|nr:sulfotransferase family 2 domain-containing protein [Marinobacter sp. LV10MA510-1]PFG08971.1 sulfotransferase family protein [Marinobacter sp. LV10MA510-1]